MNKFFFLKLFWRKILAYKQRIGKFITFRIAPICRRMVNRSQFKELEKFKDKHKGQRIFVIATGPSLREEDILKLKDEVTIGVNGTIALFDKIGWKPTYYCIGDPKSFDLYKEDIVNAHLDEAFFELSLKKYESELNFVPHYVDRYIKGCLLPPSDDRMKKNMSFSDDICRKGVYAGGRSIATIALQIAAYMGADEIYLYGQDCNYYGAKKHFDSKNDDGMPQGSVDVFIDAMFAFYEKAKEYANEKGIKIYNATRGGKLEIFERVDLDEVLK